MNWLSRLFEEHKLARRFALFWAMSLITYTVVSFVEYAPHIIGADKVFIAIIGILSVVIGFYQWSRAHDD